MKKWIRWSGLIPFSVIIAALCLFFILFIDSVIEHVIESNGSEMMEAKVELQKAEFRFSPLGITLHGLQVTNPEAPMRNLVEVERIAFNLDGGALLQRKLLINEMSIDDLRTDTPRHSSGALKKAMPVAAKKAAPQAPAANSPAGPATEATATPESAVSMPSIATPDVDTILAKEPLNTETQATALKTEIATSKDEWSELEAKLPDNKRIEAHKQNIKALQKVDYKDVAKLKAAVDSLKQLKGDINGDLKQVKTARATVNEDIKSLNALLKKLKQAPKEDYQRLLAKYDLSSGGVGQLGMLFFGDQAREWTQTGMLWYHKLQPFISQIEFSDDAPEVERHKGVDIRFPEYQPTPDFLIKQARASVDITAGRFSGEISDITHQQTVIGKPTRFNFAGEAMQKTQSLKLHGEFNRLKQEPHDWLELAIQAYDMDERPLLKEDKLRLAIKDARSDLKLSAQRRGDQISASLDNHIRDISYDNHASGGELKTLLVKAINQVDNFHIQAEMSGSLTAPKTHIKTDLDDKLGGHLKTEMNKRKAAFQKQLKERINGIGEKHRQEAEESLAAIREQYESKIQQRQQALEGQLASAQQQIDDYKAQIQAKEDAAKQQIETEKKALQKQLKQDSKGLENKSKEKLKGLFGG